MKIDASIFNTLPRAYQIQQNQVEVVAEPNLRPVNNSTDEVTISPEAYLRSQEGQAPSSIESQSEITPQNPLPDNPDNPDSSGENP